MNKENLLEMAETVSNVPAWAFDMDIYNGESECGSVGCIIGHCAIPYKKSFVRDMNVRFDYPLWSETHTGLNRYSPEWRYLFSANWVKVDNTPKGAARRIRYFVENGLPNNWKEQIEGDAPLSY